ncbi:DUF5076 domain-containing protein [Hyphomicrobium sp.]|uniref:DUF5076 domain-containing protein n=1 Tax=Hyphomicrobium sp. TaxID=82 RepID=UPI000FB64FC4|nr:DUF5076 domain-containing protein [Hyphomicrobium sp.]RUO99023.1 MAG: DUF5076 domain-containing protein [Hyphomicrobium sp.]
MSDHYDSEPLLELDVPDGVPEAEQAVELIRAWVADGSLAVTLNSEAFGPQLEEWGRVLAQIGHHIARAAALSGELGEEKSIQALRMGFDSSFPSSELRSYGKVNKRVTH